MKKMGVGKITFVIDNSDFGKYDEAKNFCEGVL